ncbi:bile acid:sodium symporter family protein [Litoribrevibacter euphylliae]|uniref:Bile acid:sodium symporter family protein n=1 Tax=Litoribrevibacter euphylliae TaxID=1834034 RepID=A0ABV7HCB9_9GAMM
MDSIVNIALLIAQSIIMFSLGIGLEVKDFKRVLERKKVVGIALIAQVLVLPVLAYLTVHLFSFPPMYAAGLMILSFCPGGVTSNIISKMAKGDVALSVSLTAVTSILAFVSVPFLVALSVTHFLGDALTEYSFSKIALVTFLITTTPVSLGVLFRHFKTSAALRIERGLERLAYVLWSIIVIGAFASAWETVEANFGKIGPGLLFLPIVMTCLGLLIGRMSHLSRTESKTLAIEASIQNSPMALTLAVLISGVSSALPDLALPAAVYSLTMYAVAFPSVLLLRRWGDGPKANPAPAYELDG